MPTQMSKSQLIEKISTATELSKRDVKNVMDTLTDVGHKELKKNGVFLVPGFAKFVVVKKPATKGRKGVNPFWVRRICSRLSQPGKAYGQGQSKLQRMRSEK